MKKATNEELDFAEEWPTWVKEPSEFEWSYPKKETCLILSGSAEIFSEEGDKIAQISAGDWVIFPENSTFRWKINEKIIKKFKIG